MKRSNLIACGALVMVATVNAQIDGEQLSAQVEEHTHSFSLKDGQLAGPGAELLIEEGRRASFFVLGERHLRNEVPGLAGALLTELRPHGYGAFAVETGEAIADFAETSFREDDGKALADLLRSRPFTAAFIDHAHEFELLGEAVGLGYELWGLDQVFVGGARFNLARLVELAPDEAARTHAEQALERANAGFEKFAESGDKSHGFLAAAGAEAYDELRDAFEGVPAALRIIDELQTSGQIYRLYDEGENYVSNHQRIQLLKRHLIEQLEQTERDTKVFMKIGGIHGVRGYTRLNQLDLGNSAAELGLLRGGGSIHVFVEAIDMVDADGESKRIVGDGHPFAPIAAAMPDSEDWVVTDLRKLRPVFHRDENAEAHPDLAEWVWQYDLVVLTREFTPAERLPGVPAPPD